MNGATGGSLQNVLSISTAANNRYLLHFNSLNSLTQWTAGIRLAMFEHATLQEAYTGSLIAGKGKHLNNIKSIMERSKFAHEDWARVRFGAGTPWKRCWCVVSQPDEKDFQKALKEQTKTLKKGAYDRKVTIPKGDIKFYDTSKVTKKTQPIATITDAYAVYAIYPQSKPLIDQSTLVKLEGLVTIHTRPESTTEGFVFIMPEVHAAVSGFEMMMRWLFPVWDTFCLYGRPNKLIADTLDQRGIMFAMPRDRRYGYLDILDVSGLIHTQGSQAWSERQWRNQLKKLTSTRMNSQMGGEESPGGMRQLGQRRNTTSRASMSAPRGGVRFGDESPSQSGPPSRTGSPADPMGNQNSFSLPRRTDSAPNGQMAGSPHKRSASDAMGYRQFQSETPSRLSYEQNRPDYEETPPTPPRHGAPYSRPGLDTIASEAEVPTVRSTYSQMNNQNLQPNMQAPQPVLTPPIMIHNANSRPANQPYQAPELRRAHSNVDAATLRQMQDATRPDNSDDDRYYQNPTEEQIRQRVATVNPIIETPADHSQGLVNQPKPRDPRQTLPNIEASPMVGGQSETFSPVQVGTALAAGAVEMGAAGVLGGRSRWQDERREEAASKPGPPVSVHSSHSITRKPVPRSTDSTTEPSTAGGHVLPQTTAPKEPSSPASSHHSSLQGLIDQNALERILGGDDHDRGNTLVSHASSATPDYASTASISTRPEDRPSYERPRAGKLKTVGDPNLPSRDDLPSRFDRWQQPEKAAQTNQMPAVDFGPTLTYKPTSRPATSGTMTLGKINGDRSRSQSTDCLRESSRDRLASRPLPRLLPSGGSEQKRQSYFDLNRSATPNPVRTPGGTITLGKLGGDHSRSQSTDRLRESSRDRLAVGTNRPLSRLSPSGGSEQKRQSYFDPKYNPVRTPRNTPGDRNTLAWEPRTTSPGPRQSLTPEQWVAHRASLASTPQSPPPQLRISSRSHSAGRPVHERQTSSSSLQHHRLRQTSKTSPPLNRSLSGDWMQDHQSRQVPKAPPEDCGFLGARTQHSHSRQAPMTPALGRRLSGNWTHNQIRDRGQQQGGGQKDFRQSVSSSPPMTGGRQMVYGQGRQPPVQLMQQLGQPSPHFYGQQTHQQTSDSYSQQQQQQQQQRQQSLGQQLPQPMRQALGPGQQQPLGQRSPSGFKGHGGGYFKGQGLGQ